MIKQVDLTPTEGRYAERDIEALGQLYIDHVLAMTEHQLDTKSEIAAELAYRDHLLLALREENARLREALVNLVDWEDRTWRIHSAHRHDASYEDQWYADIAKGKEALNPTPPQGEE